MEDNLLSIKVDVGDNPIQSKIDEFFKGIVNRIETHPLNHPSYFQVRVDNIYNKEKGIKETDDYIHRLFYKERVIACVLESRTEFNMINFDFFDNSNKIKYQ